MIYEIKGVVRLTGGYLVALKYSMQAIFGLKPGETWCAFSDLGTTFMKSLL